MSDDIQDWDEVLPHEPNGEVVHWMASKPLTVGAAGLSVAVAGAFTLGALAALAAVAMMHRRAPPPVVEIPRGRFGGR